MTKKRLTFITITVLLAILPLHVHAQLLGEPSSDRTPWGFEASVFGNMTHLDLTQVNDQIKGGPDYYYNNGVGFSDNWDKTEFEDLLVYELRLGFRFHSLHAGLGYTQLPEQEAGFTMEQGSLIQPWNLKVSSKAYYVYVGYLHTFNDWFSLGPMISVGTGMIGGSYTDFSRKIPYTDIYGNAQVRIIKDAELSGTHTLINTELRSRIQLTRYISLDIGGGIRMGDVKNLEADYGTGGVTGIDGSTGPVTDYHTEVVDLEMSGWFVGGGITLLNPLGEN